MDQLSEYTWYLKTKNKALERQLESFKTGNAYVKMRREYVSVIKAKDREIKGLEREVSKAHAETVTSRKNWSEIFDDLEKEHQKDMEKKDRENARLREQILEAQRQRDAALDELKDKKVECYQVKVELEGEKEKTRKLTIQVNKDFENSSLPSSMQGAKRKKIPNSREKTERKCGGQPGHKGHRLHRQQPTQIHMLDDPQEYKDAPEYYATQDVIRRQKIIFDVSVRVVEYQARVFRNRHTGSRVHASFPDGFHTDVSYDASVKAFAFLLNNEANVSVAATKRLLSEISGGRIQISEATINGLSREFSAKTAREKQALISQLMTSPVLNSDFTNANVSGQTRQVLIIASPSKNAAMYVARNSKGHKGIKETPLEQYVGTIVHDHDVSFYKYGQKHQECMQHNCRYLKGSIENESEREWNQKMLDLIREMLHYKNQLGEEEELDAMKVAQMELRYDEILKCAEAEYAYEPPRDYYREGYNLYRRLVAFKESELLFLHDKNVPANNSLAERLARKYKRKQKQAIVLRSDDSFAYLCECMSLLQTFRAQGKNLYEHVCHIFEKPRPLKKITSHERST